VLELEQLHGSPPVTLTRRADRASFDDEARPSGRVTESLSGVFLRSTPGRLSFALLSN
jgi:hypothetical protein